MHTADEARTSAGNTVAAHKSLADGSLPVANATRWDDAIGSDDLSHVLLSPQTSHPRRGVRTLVAIGDGYWRIV